MPSDEMKQWTVLLVDDEPDNLDFTQKMLEFYGAQVYTSKNGIEGLKLLETITPTLILLDLSMPQMDGWEMFRRIRALPQGDKLRVIALTAHAMTTHRKQVTDASFDGYLTKPFRLKELVAEMHRVVQASLPDSVAPDHSGN
jgi:CheY-like chemotaxis protein